MTLDECLKSYEETGNTLFYAYIGEERVMAEVHWGMFPDYICYRDYFGARIEVDDPDVDTWCEF